MTIDIINLSTVRQSFAQAVFNHQVQEAAGNDQNKKARYVKVANIVVVLIVLVLLCIQSVNLNNISYSYLGMGLTVFEIVFLVFQLFFDYENKMTLHKNSALKFMSLRDGYRNLIADIMVNSLSITELILRRDNLQKEYQVICDFSPQTGPKEYAEAQKKLNTRGAIEGETFTWSDGEIDRFLPEKLRITKTPVKVKKENKPDR